MSQTSQPLAPQVPQEAPEGPSRYGYSGQTPGLERWSLAHANLVTSAPDDPRLPTPEGMAAATWRPQAGTDETKRLQRSPGGLRRLLRRLRAAVLAWVTK